MECVTWALWVIFVGHCHGSNSWVILVGKTCGSFSWVKLVGQTCGWFSLVKLVVQTRWSFLVINCHWPFLCLGILGTLTSQNCPTILVRLWALRNFSGNSNIYNLLYALFPTFQYFFSSGILEFYPP